MDDLEANGEGAAAADADIPGIMAQKRVRVDRLS